MSKRQSTANASTGTSKVKSAGSVTRAELEVLRQKITDLAEEKPQKAAVILTDWIKRSSSRKAG